MDEENGVRSRQQGNSSRNTLASKTIRSSDRDARALAKHGKRQQLDRNFGIISAIAFNSIILSCWEAIATTIGAGFLNGGPVSLIYGFLLSWTGTLALCLSLAEMASIAPISSAQYHFVAMLTPPGASKLLSWLSGWITVFAWQSNIASVGYLAATQIQALVMLNYESYVYERWHGSMLFCAVVMVSICVNVFGIKILPQLETIAGILHVCLFFVFLVPFIYLSPHPTAAAVFTDFENHSGWNNNVVSWCIGLLTVTYPLIGFEGVCHLSEEIKDAPMTVPRSMVLSFVINGVLAFAFLIALLFGVPDIEGALNSPTKSPIVEIMYQIFQSKIAATAVVGLFVVVLFCVVMGMVASTSRLTWAFARDNGLPFSRTIAYVHPLYKIPVNAILLNALIAMLINLINIASSTAFSALVSLTTVSLYASYILPIAIMIQRRLRNDEPNFGPYTLGRYGLLVNVIAILWGTFAVIFEVFPTEMPVTAANMNYASLVFGSAVIFSLVTWFLYGGKTFQGPVNELDEGSVAFI
uniref:Putative choline transport protein n=1 Tax=Cladonia uncialis subsp. uncialis TaxID=180999 RepID=A0A2K9YEQ7_CLAUC|nr:putative choline transport protein [Cladonia uncialis subsp. uncialis]